MKRLILLHLFFTILRIPEAQVVVTWSDNAFRPGDSVPWHRVSVAEAGPDGAGVTWDFTGLEISGQVVPSVIYGYAPETPEGIGKFDHILQENGFKIFQTIGTWGYREEGFINPQRRITVIYDDPAERMHYPMAWGDSFSDHFRGAAVFQGQRLMEITGDIRVTADAWGTMLLPGMSLEGVLRIKTMRTVVQTTPCGTSVTLATRYSWYARGYRYAILHLNIFEDITDSVPVFLNRTAYLYTAGRFQEETAEMVQDLDGDPGDGYAVRVYPNPFRERMICRFALKSPAVVTIELLAATGQTIACLVQQRFFPEGIQEELLDLTDLAMRPGVYFICLRIDERKVVRKVVMY